MLAEATPDAHIQRIKRLPGLPQAYALVANILDQQATMLAYIDNFWLLAVTVLVMIPFVFLMKKVKPGGPIAVH